MPESLIHDPPSTIYLDLGDVTNDHSSAEKFDVCYWSNFHRDACHQSQKGEG